MYSMVNNEFNFGFRCENCAENKIQMTSDFKYAIRNTRVRDGRILKIIILWVITARYC